MNNGGRPDEKQIAVLAVGAYRQFLLMLGQNLALLGRFGADYLSANVCPNYMALPHVAHAKHKTELAISLADYGVP